MMGTEMMDGAPLGRWGMMSPRSLSLPWYSMTGVVKSFHTLRAFFVLHLELQQTVG